MQIEYEAKCDECVCNKCCKDVGKKKYCKYFTKFESDIERYYHMFPGFCKEDTIKKYLEDRHAQEVKYAKETLKMYGIFIAVALAVGICILATHFWHVDILRYSFFACLCPIGIEEYTNVVTITN